MPIESNEEKPQQHYKATVKRKEQFLLQRKKSWTNIFQFLKLKCQIYYFSFIPHSTQTMLRAMMLCKHLEMRRCNFSFNLQRHSSLSRCKIGKYMFLSMFSNIFLTYQIFVTNLHPLRVELRCNLHEK